MNGPAFRSLCHSLGLSAQAVAKLARVQERSVRHWWADGQPPEDVVAQVLALDQAITRQCEALAAQAETLLAELPPGERAETVLMAYRTESAWWAAHPEFHGLPITAHSVMLRRSWEVLQGLGFEVSLKYL